VKIIIHGPLAGAGWAGGPALESWGPDQAVEVDDRNEKAVAWARGWAATPHATLVEDVAAPEPEAVKEPRAPKGETRRRPPKPAAVPE
jgi:hypothetical protein